MEVLEGEPAVEKKPEKADDPPESDVSAPAAPAPIAALDSSEVRPVPQTSMANTAYETDRPPVPPGASTTDTLIGQNIDHFEIRAQLGQGGMGTVYLAHDLSLERPVAIKVLRRELASSPDLVGRLVLEARAQARLQHPNVVNVYYIGQHEGAPYLAMEYVRGKTLADRLEGDGPIPWAEALDYIIQTTRALMEAKHRGIVHRDVKPSNLLLGRMGPKNVALPLIKVADFGLAATTEGKDEHFVGSPYYASPEQIAGKPPDHRSDVYSLGVTFHELLTGAPPFEADSLRALIKLHEDAPRPVIPARQAPWRLRQLITEMMDPHPANRPTTYEELLERLEALRPQEVIPGGVVARGMAQALDLGVFAVLGHLLGLVLDLSMRAAYEITFTLFGVYTVLGHRRWGQTLGKRLFRLSIQGTSRALTVPRLLLRFVVKFWGPLVAMLMLHFSLAWTFGSADVRTVKDEVNRLLGWGEIPFLDTNVEDLVRLFWGPNIALALPWMAGFLFAIFDRNRRAVHDLCAHTRVVYSMRKEPRRPVQPE